MAEVYGYLKPFARLAVFAKDKIRELKEEIENLEIEKKMWNEPEVMGIVNVWSGMPSKLSEKNFLSFHQLFGSARIKQLKTMICIRKKELEKWQTLLVFMKVCSRCNGEGTHHSAGGYVNCENCKGSGSSD